MTIRDGVPDADIERQVLPHLPDHSDQAGYSSELPELLLVEEFGDGADLPIVGAFNDHAGKCVGMLVSGQGDGTVEVNGAPIPALRGNRRRGSLRRRGRR